MRQMASVVGGIMAVAVCAMVAVPADQAAGDAPLLTANQPSSVGSDASQFRPCLCPVCTNFVPAPGAVQLLQHQAPVSLV